MSSEITGGRLTSLFRPRSVALVGASDKSVFSMIAYQNLVRFGFGERTYLVNRRGAETHGQPTVTSCMQIGEPVDVAYLMVPQAGMLAAMDDAAAAGIRNAVVLSSGYGEAGEAGRAAQAELAAALGRLERPGIGIVSISGGACDIVADRADDLGAELPELAEPTRQALAQIMPAYGTVQNPLDVTGAAIIDPSIFTKSIEAMSADPGIGVIGVVNGVPWIDNGRPYMAQMFVDAIGAGIQSARCPVAYINQVMQPITGYTRAIMERGQVPYVIPGLRQAVVALRNVAWWSQATQRQETVQAPPAITVPAPGRRRGRWSEEAARQLLTAAGIPVVPGRLVSSADEAVKAAAEFGARLVLKVVSPQILHKSDIGGVRLNVPADEQAIRDAYAAVTAAAGTVDGARVEGVLVSPMRSGGNAGSPAPLPMPLQPLLVNEAWQRIDAAADAGHEGALALESFFIGQVVGSFTSIRPAADITRQIVTDCEQRIAELGALL